MKRRSSGVLSCLTATVLLLSQVLMCGCSSKKTEEATSSSETTTSAEVTSSSEEVTTTTEPETTASSSEETTTETWESELPETTVNGRDITPYKEITLDGIKEHHFIADDYCYIESDKFVLFLEKDIEIPGDFVVNVDAIIDELEKELGVSYAPDSYYYLPVPDESYHYGTNPWKDWNIGSKIPIFLNVDRNDEALISCATADFAIFVMYELFSEEFWNSVPSFRDNSWRRHDYVDYSTIAHELTHTITSRHHDMSMIMTEGIADYMGRTVLDALADSYPSIAEARANVNLYDERIPEAVNAENAERIFIEDYSDIDHAHRGAEYTFGRYLCQFLDENYGNDYYKKFNDAIIGQKINYQYGIYDKIAMTKFADVMKELFGEDVFTKFGKWCESNNYLQK
ncbi:MAG: hypothetical protein J6Y58_06320 [Clostridiales bacterium]|nr:hypothetical protein [Clostridiales bacterium]